MGNICHNVPDKLETDDTTDFGRNLTMYTATLGDKVTIDLISGHSKEQRGDTIWIIVEANQLETCDSLKDYINGSEKLRENIQPSRITFLPLQPNKRCPYKKVLLCCLPHYRSEEQDKYQLNFTDAVRKAVEHTHNLTLEFFNTVEGLTSLPNQLLLATLFGELAKLHQLKRVLKLKINMLTNQRKMMNLYRYELMKLPQYKIEISVSHEESARKLNML